LDNAGRINVFKPATWPGTRSAVVLTTQDQVVSPAIQRELCRVLANPVVHEVEGDHFVCVKRPVVFNHVLVNACAGVESQNNRARQLARAL
jgi:hypothetical protein